MSYNRVILLGNLSRDIELKYTNSGTAIAKSAIATNRRYKRLGAVSKKRRYVSSTSLYTGTLTIM